MASIEKHLERAEKYAAKGRFENALQEYQKAYELAPQDLDLLRTIADLYVRAGKKEEALKHYGELFDKYAKKGDVNRGVAVFRQLQEVPQPPERHVKLGDLLSRGRKKKEAAQAYRAALQLFQQAGKTAELLAILEKLTEIEPDSADNHVQLGEQALRAGKAQKAGEAFLRAGQLLRPDNLDRALDLLSRAYELAPERGAALSLAQAQLDKGNAPRAAELLLPLFGQSRDEPGVLETLSTALLESKRLEEAEQVLEALYQVKPNGYEKLFDLVHLYAQQNEGKKTVALLERLKARLFKAKRKKEFLDRLESLLKAGEDVLLLCEFAARTYNELNQEGHYTMVLGKLFQLYCAAQEYSQAADTLDRLIDIDPYDFENQRRLERLQGKVDDKRARALSARISGAATVGGQASVFTPAEEKIEARVADDPAGRQALLEDLIVQTEIFLQYSLKAKAIEKLQKIWELFAGEEAQNERLYNLYQQAGYTPEGFGASASADGRAPGAVPAAAPPSAASSPLPAAMTADAVSGLAKISEITHTLFRQATPKAVLHAAVSELGKYLKASRCLGTIGRPGKPPSAAVEFCAPGVPSSPGPAIVKLLGLVGQVNLDPEKGAALDTQLTPELKKVGIQSALAMALQDKESEEQEGLIILAQADQPRPWRPNEVYLLKAVADQAVTAMSHIKLRSLMKRLSVADDASGLLARSSYLDCLVGEVGRAKSQGTPLVVALLELDQASELRRHLGNAEIQKLMQQVREVVLSGARQNDLAFRYTPTSLALVLGDTTADKVQSVIDKLRAKLGTFKLGDRDVTFSAALSEAAIRPDYDAEDIVTDVVNRAEFSLEKAREKGNVTVAQ